MNFPAILSIIIIYQGMTAYICRWFILTTAFLVFVTGTINSFFFEIRANNVNRCPLLNLMYECILRARVQPILDPYAEAFYSRPIALNQEGRSLVNDVCECVRD